MIRLPEALDCGSCGRETALGTEVCACGAEFDPLLRASEAALESLEHKECAVLDKHISDDPTESGYRRSRLGKPKGQSYDYRLSASFFEDGKEKDDRKNRSSHLGGVSFPSRSSVSIRTLSLGGSGVVPEFNGGVPSFEQLRRHRLSDVCLPGFGDREEETEEKNGDDCAGTVTDKRELHLREYDDRYTLHWDAHPATSPMHAVRDAPDYGAACVAAAGVVAAAVGSRVVKRRNSSSPDG